MEKAKQKIETFTFKVEPTISSPKKLFQKYTLEEISSTFFGKIYASSFKKTDKICFFGQHALLEGLYQAYVNHCPIVLSPDIFWTLIIQGFTRHVLANSESLRKNFVNFEGKKELKVDNNKYPNIEDIPQEVWEENIKTFIKDMSNYISQDLIDLMKPNFSTTTKIISQVGQINIMSCMQNFFEYVSMHGGCGYPEITLEGTLDDYINLKEKTKQLEKYNLKSWIDEILKILDKIIETKKGKVDTNFWKKMYYNGEGSIESSGTTQKVKIIKGWLCKFVPYKKQNIPRDELEELEFMDPFFSLPVELLNAPIKMKHSLTGDIKDLVIRAGFIGMEQNENNYEMKPVFGWFVTDINLGMMNRKFS